MKSHTKIFFIYNIGYVTIKYSKYVEINIVNPLHLYFGEINRDEYLTLVPTNESKEKAFKN